MSWKPDASHDVEHRACVRCSTVEREFAITLKCPYQSPVTESQAKREMTPTLRALVAEIAEAVRNAEGHEHHEKPVWFHWRGVDYDSQSFADVLLALSVPSSPPAASEELDDIRALLATYGMTPESRAIDYIKGMAYRLRKELRERANQEGQSTHGDEPQPRQVSSRADQAEGEGKSDGDF